MKQPLALAALGIALIVGALLWKSDRSEMKGEDALPAQQTSSPNPAFESVESSTDEGEKPSVGDSADSEIPQGESLRAMTRTLMEYAQVGAKLDDLLEDLDRSGQKPFVVKDKNPYTGELSIVRTKSPLPGTRYFHAQYFSGGEAGDGYFQHISFEFRPGPQALASAMQAVYSVFPQIGKPRIDREDFKEWHLDNGYTVWIKKLDMEHISQGDPFNAYTAADVGTIRVAIEENPHDGNGEEEDGHEGHEH